jgi:hypothetical protein
MFKRLKEMKVIVHILTSLAVCTGIPAVCDFVFVYVHAYSKFDCLTEVLLVCPTLKPPTIWQLGKYRLRRGRRLLLFFSSGARTYNKDRLFLSRSRKRLFREVKKKQ